MAAPPLPEVARIDPGARPDARAALAAMLCRAFDRDPHINWIVRQDARRAEAMAALFGLMLGDLLGRRGEVHATAGLRAAAIWYPPGAAALGLAEQARVALRFAAVTGWGAWPLRAWGLNRMALGAPRVPHYFLQTLGVDPDSHGRGHGRALLEAFAARCGRDGVAGYLETANPDNLAYYERHGYRILAEARLPDGPPLWRLLRPARVVLHSCRC